MDIKRLGVNQEELLIQMALGPPAKDLAEWKTKLKYLGVCRHWRSVATKIVYSQAFIELGIGSTGYSDDEYYEDDDLDNDDLDNDDFDTSLPYKSSSNIGLIVSVRKMHCVRSLSMKTTCVIDSAFLCQEIARLLKLNPTYWITVNELIADFSKAEPLLGAKSSGLNRMSTIYYGLAEIIFKHVPNITMLISRLEYERNACTLFVSYLANQYLSRLYSLSCDTPLLLKSRLPLNTLKIVDMTMVRNERGQSLPSMNGGDLKSISLRKLPYDYSWGSFHYNLATPASIEFVSLKYLLVEYHRKPDEDDKVALDLLKTERPYKYQLLFPALEHLTILRTPLNCDVLFTETNFKHLRMVELNGDIQALNAYTRLKLDTVDHLNVFATPGRDYTEEELYYVTNHFFGKVKTKSKGYLTIGMPMTNLFPTAVTWFDVTRLVLYHAKFTTITALVPLLSRLQEFYLFNLTFDGIPSYDLDISGRKDILENVIPNLPISLDSKIRMLWLFIEGDNMAPENKFIVKYFLEKVPTLSYLSLEYFSYTEEYLDALQESHPLVHITKSPS